MNNNNKTWFAMIIIGYIVVLMAYVINVVSENTPAIAGNKPTAAAEDSLAIECGSCGAHVHDWWYVENINDGKSVEVCEFCYHNYVENTNTEN